MKKYIVPFLIVSAFACKHTAKSNRPEVKYIKNSVEKLNTDQADEETSDNEEGSTDTESKEELYMRTGNPDTALALFLYRNYSNVNWDDYTEEYMRWDLEHEKIKKLLVALYLHGNTNDAILSILEKNRQLFVKEERAKVQSDYKKYNSVAGPDFAFLIERKDPIVKPILLNLLNNANAPADEKEYGRSVLKNMK